MSSHAAPAVPEGTRGKPDRDEVLARLEVAERTDHMRCADCGRFVPRARWTPKLKEQRRNPNARIVTPLCDGCHEEHDPPEW